jgi:hypothetical protein
MIRGDPAASVRSPRSPAAIVPSDDTQIAHDNAVPVAVTASDAMAKHIEVVTEVFKAG